MFFQFTGAEIKMVYSDARNRVDRLRDCATMVPPVGTEPCIVFDDRCVVDFVQCCPLVKIV